jgi:hypothetical protein
MANLLKAAESFEDPACVIDKGISAINNHCGNYTADGPEAKCLQLLWWEFPEEHWQPLREGSRMNFLRTSKAIIHDNATMDPEQTQVAGEFVKELLDLWVVQLPRDGRKILTTALSLWYPGKTKKGNGE